MKKYKVRIGDKQFIVDAEDKVDAVKKLNDAQAKKISDSIDAKHYAEYGWKIDNDLARESYWEAVGQLAGKLKSEEEYKREIPKLARQLFESHIKEIKAEFERLIGVGRARTSDYDKWTVELARNIIKKQSN